MKAKEIATRYGLDQRAFTEWIRTTQYEFTMGSFSGMNISDHQDIDAIVSDFKWCMQQQQEELERRAEEEKRAEEAKQRALASMLITSGFSFDGYSVAKYSGYISGDDVVQVSRGQEGWFSNSTTDVGSALMEALVHMRRRALTELKEAAYALGCNAVIGVDFDYITLEPETVNNSGGVLYLPYVFGVTANGNAVVIEKR